MVYFSRRLQLEPYWGGQYKFQSIELGAEAETFEQAQKEVEEAIKKYILESDHLDLSKSVLPF